MTNPSRRTTIRKKARAPSFGRCSGSPVKIRRGPATVSLTKPPSHWSEPAQHCVRRVPGRGGGGRRRARRPVFRNCGNTREESRPPKCFPRIPRRLDGERRWKKITGRGRFLCGTVLFIISAEPCGGVRSFPPGAHGVRGAFSRLSLHGRGKG